MSDRRIAGMMYLNAITSVFVVTFILIIPSLSSAQAQTTPTSAERKELLEVRQLVWESYFRNNQANLKELIGEDFITINPGEQHWQNHNEFVAGDDAFARAKAKSADAVKVRVGSYTDFAKVVSTSKAKFNPTHTHLQMNSDGTIASVYFDFVFLVDGKEQNRGSETWVLIKGSEGWRIAAITYSSNPPA